MKKQTGIWLDLRNAWVINLPIEQDGAIVAQHITSGVEEHAATENTRMDTSWGPHGGNNQRTVEESLHHEEKHYFADILKHIHPTTEESWKRKYSPTNLLKFPRQIEKRK